MLSILDRALLKEMGLAVGAVMSILSLIIVGQLFVRLISQAADGRIPQDVILALLGLGVIKSVVQLMPLALLLGIMLTFGRLYRDSEMTAMRSCGIGLSRLYRPVVLLATPVVVLLAVLALYVSPLSIRLADKMAFEAEHRTDISGITEGRFIQSKQGNWVVFAERMDRREGTLDTVFVHNRVNGVVTIETATRARQITDPATGDDRLVLSDGFRYEGTPGRGDYQILTFDKHTMRVPPLVGSPHKGLDGVPSAVLWKSDTPPEQAELQWRMSIPLAAVLLVLLALPLSYAAPRQGRFGKLALAVILYIIYSNLTIFAMSLTQRGELPVPIGVWWVHLLMLVFIAALFVRQYGWRWSLRKLTLRSAA